MWRERTVDIGQWWKISTFILAEFRKPELLPEMLAEAEFIKLCKKVGKVGKGAEIAGHAILLEISPPGIYRCGN